MIAAMYLIGPLVQAQIGSLHGAGTTNPSKLVSAPIKQPSPCLPHTDAHFLMDAGLMGAMLTPLRGAVLAIDGAYNRACAPAASPHLPCSRLQHRSKGICRRPEHAAEHTMEPLWCG